MQLNIEVLYKAVSSQWEIGEFMLKDALSFSNRTLLFFYQDNDDEKGLKELKDFSYFVPEFSLLKIPLIWISKNSIESHKKTIESKKLNIDLISDPKLILHKELNILDKRLFRGRIIRSTFLVNQKWEILKEWRDIDAEWHAQKVLDELL